MHGYASKSIAMLFIKFGFLVKTFLLIQFHLQSGLPSIHDMKLVQELFPRTIVMDEGQVVAHGWRSCEMML